VEVVAMGAKDVLGREGEQAAVSYLEGRGFRILDRNWRCADGEIDIVAVERHTFVACSPSRPRTSFAPIVTTSTYDDGARRQSGGQRFAPCG
jgi:hypothetical protein